MKKIVSPSFCDVGRSKPARSFATIKIQDGCLSICGVIGPTSNGNSTGGAGQCVDEISKGTPAEGWSQEMLDKFCSIWREWHLNEMTPYCEHQKELGWDKLALKKVSIYHFRRTREGSDLAQKAEAAAVRALKNGETFTPTEDQVFFANLPYALTSHEPELKGKYAPYFEHYKPLYSGDRSFEETKLLGHLFQTEHPDGILSKPCPVCGYKYGSAWLKRELPEDVVKFLSQLPDSLVRPAWEP